MTSGTGTSEWLAELRELCEVTMDAEGIRRKLHKKAVPASLRGVIWQVVMRVRSKPDALNGKELVKAEDGSALQQDCKTLAERFAEEGSSAEKTHELAEEMEMILGFYAKSKNTEYTSALGWAELLAPFMAVPLSRGDRYNCFYVLMSKYAVKDCSKKGVCFEVFRLLLQYHDSELCNLLDSVKIGPKDFAQTWIRSMFAAWCTSDVTLSLWDAYFMGEDQFFVFFLSLVMLINGKDYVVELSQNPETLASELESMPSGLEEGDIVDMCELAEHFSLTTPQSFRAQYSNKLFGTRTQKSSVEKNMLDDLCLSVPVETILRHTEGAIKFFVVDTRPLAQFDAGHLPYAWHLDASLMTDKPTMFADEVLKMEDALLESMQHPCFMSSGRDVEDQQLAMVIAHLLQKKHKYVSFVRGGFEALHTRLLKEGAGRLKEALAGHSEERKLELKDEVEEPVRLSPSPVADAKPKESKWGLKFSGLKTGLRSYAAKTSEKVATASASAKQSILEKSSQIAAKTTEMAQRFNKDPNGKALYRGSDRGSSELFSIDGDDDGISDPHSSGKGGGADLDLGGAIVNSSGPDVMVHINKLTKQSRIKYVFKCSEVSTEGYLFPSHVVLTSSHILKLRDKNAEKAVLLSRRPLLQITKITAKKKHPNLLTFVFEVDPKTVETTPTTQSKAPTPSSPKRQSQPDSDPNAKAEATKDETPAFEIGDPDDADESLEADDDDTNEDNEDNSVTTTATDTDADAEVDSTTETKQSTDTTTEQETKEGDSNMESEGGTKEEEEVPQTTVSQTDGDGAVTEAEDVSNFIEIREMFMVPEAGKAKQAFRDLIIALNQQKQNATAPIQNI